MALEMTQRPLSISVDNKTYTMREVLIVYTRRYNERKYQHTIDTATANQSSKIHINASKECKYSNNNLFSSPRSENGKEEKKFLSKDDNVIPIDI
jgi:hypothetical protein